MCIVQWLRVKVLSVFQPKGSSPLPTGIILALFVSMFGNAIAMQMLFAFLPDMVKSFGIADEDAGYYVGMIASVVFLGRFISSYFWGWLSDKIGRRQVLLWCTGLLAVTTLAFGFARSFEVALLIRFITGLIAGIPGTVKASLAEVCDDSNQALGMSVVVTAWNTGLIIGPAVGGYLAKPASKYPVFKDNSFFEHFAYLLPCVVNAAINFFSFLLVFFVLPETLTSMRKTKDKEMLPVTIEYPEETVVTTFESSPSNRQRFALITSPNQNELPNGDSKQHGDESTIEIQKPLSKSSEMQLLSGSVSFLAELHLQNYPFSSGSRDDVDMVKEEPFMPRDGKPKPGLLRRTSKTIKHSKLSKLCRNKDVRYVVGMYTVYSFAAVGEHELYSLWAATGSEFGGLEFDTNELGFTLMIVGIGCAFSNFIVFPKFVKIFGLLKTQYITLMTTMFCTIILPATNILYGRGPVLKVAVIAVLMILRIAQGCCLTGVFIFLGNCVTSDLRATVHGFAMTMVCAARTVSPTVVGSVFSWSITSGLGFPFNEKCVFIFLGIVVWIALVVACCFDVEAVTKQSKT